MKIRSLLPSAIRKAESLSRVALIAATSVGLPVSGVAQSLAPSSASGSAMLPANALSEAVPPALLLARRKVANYFAEAANMVCAESVTQAMLGKNDKPFYHEDSVYEYQLRASTDGGTLKLVESRETRKSAYRDPGRTLLITNGFTSMLLIVHSDYKNSYTFEADGEEAADGATLSRVRFTAIPGALSPAAMQLRGRSYPVPLSGTLWIDAKSGAVAKLIASVDSSMSDLGLQGMRSEVHYGLVQFHNPEEAYWMPVSATIDVQTPRQHWRNVHRFGSCKRFRADVKIDPEKKP